MGSVGPGQLLIILLIVLVLFGAGRLADIGKGLGQGIHNFKKGMSGEDPADRREPRASAEPPKQLTSGDERVARTEEERKQERVS